ncbi:hypothetical protein J3R83DRAFT_8087 [Lanmaoa asiatica]|nr:hypothetical protein J3R83DRAFT_8087 [Lanmaoa asiatica]
MFFYISLFASLALLVMLGYRYRAAVLPHVPTKVRSLLGLNQYTSLSTFSGQAEAGLTSVMFDIEANINDADSRAGLDERGTQEVLDIMRRERVNFDQARLIRHNQILARNGIDPSDLRDAARLQGRDAAMNDQLLSTWTFLVGYRVLTAVSSHIISRTLPSLSNP